MKLDCGPSPETKRKRRYEKERAEIKRLKNWHDYFALLPRRIGENDCRWLETIERKGKFITDDPWEYDFWEWEYRAKQD